MYTQTKNLLKNLKFIDGIVKQIRGRDMTEDVTNNGAAMNFEEKARELIKKLCCNYPSGEINETRVKVAAFHLEAVYIEGKIDAMNSETERLDLQKGRI